MFVERVKQKMKYVPNCISIARILMIPFFCLSLLGGNYVAALIILAVSGISDCFDGYIARKYNAITVLGKWLDPIGDKLTLVAVLVCLWVRLRDHNPFVTPLMFIMIGKELILTIGGLVLRRVSSDILPSQLWGKVATVVFYVTMCLVALLMCIMENGKLLDDIITVLLALNTVTMLYALIRYVVVAIDVLRDKSGAVLENYNKNQNKNILEMVRNDSEDK